jgi:hypothetical protein
MSTTEGHRGKMTDPPEVWFHRARWGGRYVPIHWKGFIVLLGGIGLAGGGFFAGLILRQQSSLFYAMGCIFAGAVILGMLVVAKQHSDG